MRPLVTCLTALALLSTVSSQNFNPQPQLGDYPPLDGDYISRLGGSRSGYDYVGEDPSYYVPSPYSPGSGINPIGTFSNPPQRDGYVPFSGESLPPSEFPNNPDIFPKYGVQSNQYNPGSREPVFPVNPLPYPYPSSDFENYAPTFNSPPLQGSYGPQSPVTLPASYSPNIIREEADGKQLSETKSSSTNQTFQSLIPPLIHPNYGQNAVPTTINNGRAYPVDIYQYYPETNFPSQSYNPNFRQFGNQFPVENIQPSVNLSPEFQIDPNQRLLNTGDPNPAGSISSDNQYPDDLKKIFVSNPPIYPSAQPGDVPDISLSGSPRNLGGPSSYGGFAPSGLQPSGDDLPPLPNVSYEAPGHQVSA